MGTYYKGDGRWIGGEDSGGDSGGIVLYGGPEKGTYYKDDGVRSEAGSVAETAVGAYYLGAGGEDDGGDVQGAGLGVIGEDGGRDRGGDVQG